MILQFCVMFAKFETNYIRNLFSIFIFINLIKVIFKVNINQNKF